MRKFSGRPIFICGWPRGGTRMIADLVTSHPAIIPCDEVPNSVTSLILAVVEKGDLSFRKRPYRARAWSPVRQDYFLNAVTNTYRSSIIDAGLGRRRFCNKTPFSEFYFERISNACNLEKPVFVYCVRHPRKVLKSLMNMDWNTKLLKKNLMNLVNSTKTADTMIAGGASLKVVQVDKVSESPEDRLNFSKDIFDFLGEDLSDEVVSHVRTWNVAQPMGQVLKERPVADFSEADERFLGRSRHYKALCRKFSYL